MKIILAVYGHIYNKMSADLSRVDAAGVIPK